MVNVEGEEALYDDGCGRGVLERNNARGNLWRLELRCTFHGCWVGELLREGGEQR